MKPVNEVNIHTWKLDVDDDHIPEKAIAQANWNQNDETAADFVKNRPFYSEIVEHAETVLLEETIINTSPCTISEYAAPFVVGDNYKVTWDGTVYECVAYQCDGAIAIGNASIVDSSGSASIDVDFFVGITSSGMLIFNIGSQSAHTISISNGGNEEIIVRTIDKKYLPKLIGSSGEGENSGIFNSVDNNASGGYSHAEGFTTTAIATGSPQKDTAQLQEAFILTQKDTQLKQVANILTQKEIAQLQTAILSILKEDKYCRFK